MNGRLFGEVGVVCWHIYPIQQLNLFGPVYKEPATLTSQCVVVGHSMSHTYSILILTIINIYDIHNLSQQTRN